MYNLLLVDDEPSVVKGLAYDIEWSDLNVTGVYKTYSAAEAIRQMEHVRIDIVVSDISMPNMDGISLAEYIHVHWPSAVVIFLSGYDDFEYAQKAVELGVIQYVTKPVDYVEFKKTISKAVDRLERELVRDSALRQAVESLQQIRPLLQERVLQAWIVKGTENPLANASRFADAGLFFEQGEVFAPVVFRVEQEGATEGAEPALLELALKELAVEWLLGMREGIIFQNEQGQWLLLNRAANREECTKRVKYMEGAAERFKESVWRTAACSLSIFIGEMAEADGIYAAYRKLEAVVRRTVVEDSGVIVLADPPRQAGQAAGYARLESLYLAPELTLLLDKLDLDASLKRIDIIFAEAERRASLDRVELLEIYHIVSGAIIQASVHHGMALSQWMSGCEPFLDPLRSMGRAADLKKWCRTVIQSLIGQLRTLDKVHYNRLLEQSKRIVEENYSRDITVAEIAAYLYVHPSYLTRVFKANTGLSLIDYISRKRIDEAKLLLAQPGYKVYEVAKRVGYESIAHFNRMFKRETGMSPKDYQRTVIPS